MVERAVDNISFLRENVVDWSGECVAVVVLFSPIECRADVASLELGLVLRDMHARHAVKHGDILLPFMDWLITAQ